MGYAVRGFFNPGGQETWDVPYTCHKISTAMLPEQQYGLIEWKKWEYIQDCAR
jgi:hypothetical protein